VKGAAVIVAAGRARGLAPAGQREPGRRHDEGTTNSAMSNFKQKLALGAATLAAVGGAVALGTAGVSPASADPVQYRKDHLVGVGSDTTQEVLNAFAGFTAGTTYPALRTPSGGVQILSFDATDNGLLDSCIETRTGSAAMYRPNGSSEGRRALSRSYTGSLYGIPACGVKNISGLVDFARSSSGPGSTQTPQQLTYIPFARDAVTFAYYNVGGTPTTTLTTANLTSLFSTGPQSIGGKVIVPCGIQKGSGTYQFWLTASGVDAAQDDTGTAFCNNLGGVPQADGRLQESKTDQLRDKGDILATTSNPICDGVSGGAAVSCANVQVIAGFSASAYIAAGNGVANNTFDGSVLLGAIDALGSPVGGTAPNLTAQSGFYSSGRYGRDVYNVLPKEITDDPFNAPVQEMFVGPSSQVCQATSTIQAFGYLSLGASCGSTSLFGPYLSGQK
jgi:hypothetical protein